MTIRLPAMARDAHAGKRMSGGARLATFGHQRLIASRGLSSPRSRRASRIEEKEKSASRAPQPPFAALEMV